MKTFEDYVRVREAMVADDAIGGGTTPDDDEVFDLLLDLMKDAWRDDPENVIQALRQMEAKNPGKYKSRIDEIEKLKKSPYGKGLDKPDDPVHTILKPEADRVGDPAGDS